MTVVDGLGTSWVTLVTILAVLLGLVVSRPGRTVSLVGMGTGPRTEDCGTERMEVVEFEKDVTASYFGEGKGGDERRLDPWLREVRSGG